MQNDQIASGQPLINLEAAVINNLFEGVKDALRGVAEQTRVFAARCVECGNALEQKKAGMMFGEWLPWLETNCPEISHDTAARLMSIAKNYTDAATLPDRIESVRGLYLVLKKSAETTEGGTPATAPETPAKPSKICSAIARFWGAIKRHQPECWHAEERQEFLTDLAERERIRRKQGWELPPIDVEAETL